MASHLSLQAARDESRPAPGLRAEAQRVRLMLGMTDAVAEKGYAAVTIGDVVRHAGVSRRTFYERFPDKEACFLAAYDFVTELIRTEIADAARQDLPWEQRLLAGVDAYLAGMVREPAMTRVFVIEILGAGPAAIARRRDVHERFAELLRTLVEEARAGDGTRLEPLSVPASLALIGGLNELILVATEAAGSEVALAAVRDEATRFVRSVITGPGD